MKKKLTKRYRLVIIFSFLYLHTYSQQQFNANYDEDKVGEYLLPDVLLMSNGDRVKDTRQWERKRYFEILSLFKEHVYGVMPGKPRNMYFSILNVDNSALGGSAIRKQIRIFFTRKNDSSYLDLLLYLPLHVNKPVPVFIGLNFYGNHTVHVDSGIVISNTWVRKNQSFNIVGNRATEKSRGAHASRWPIEEILKQGYGVATAYYGDVEPDHKDGWKTGIRTSLAKELKTLPQNWSAIGSWAWALSRMMDYLETDKDVNAKQVIVTGHSRLGKAALWAAANDKRFAIVVSNNSGEGGAALARRNYGETIERITTTFPYWFVDEYRKYSRNVYLLPVDQHMLLSLMAPRPLYVASAEDDRWADPKGEFLGLKHAEPVYQLYNKKGLGVDKSPGVETPVGETLRYHVRRGEHNITLYDWQQYLKFANNMLKGK